MAAVFVSVSSYHSLSALAVRQRRLHLPSAAVVVVSEDEKKKDVFYFSSSSLSLSSPKCVDCLYRRAPTG